MSSPLFDAYLRFLELSRAMTERHASELDANHRALLDAIVLAWHRGQALTVRQCIGLKALGSPATLHKRLMLLRSSGMIVETPKPGDRRTILLAPSDKSVRYFCDLGQALQPQGQS